MSKIVRAVNSIIENAEKITEVHQKEKEFFFLYDDKYKWSIIQIEDNYHLYLYPGNETLFDLMEIVDWDLYGKFITYQTEDLKTREAEESFGELYLIVKEKLYDVDTVLDDIIGDEN